MTVYTRESGVASLADEFGEAEYNSGVTVVGSWNPADHPLPNECDVAPLNIRPTIGPRDAFCSTGAATVAGFLQGPSAVDVGSVVVFVGADRRDAASWAHYPRGSAEPFIRYER